MNVAYDLDGAGEMLRPVPAEAAKREHPHGEVVEVLAVAVRFLADAVAARATENAVDRAHEILGLIEERRLFEVAVERDKQDQAEGVGPQIAQPVRPDALAPHPVELGEDVIGPLKQSPLDVVSASASALRPASRCCSARCRFR